MGGIRHSCRTLIVVLYAAVEDNCTGGLIIEVFGDTDKVFTDAVLLHGFPQSCMPNPVQGLFEVYEDIVEVLLVLGIFLGHTHTQVAVCWILPKI